MKKGAGSGSIGQRYGSGNPSPAKMSRIPITGIGKSRYRFTSSLIRIRANRSNLQHGTVQMTYKLKQTNDLQNNILSSHLFLSRLK
jgi:hypothetical protein